MSSEGEEPTGAPASSRKEDPARKLRARLIFWRIGVVLSLAMLGWLWVRSWSRIDIRFVPLGAGGVEFCLAGSSCAVTLMEHEFPTVAFDPLGPPDSAHLLHFDTRWPDGDAFGRVSNSCLFAPNVDSVERIDLDRSGSFGARFTSLPGPAGPWIFFHLRVPLWFFAALLIGGWIWIEYSIRRRTKI